MAAAFGEALAGWDGREREWGLLLRGLTGLSIARERWLSLEGISDDCGRQLRDPRTMEGCFSSVSERRKKKGKLSLYSLVCIRQSCFDEMYY
jgi:hypothetical protein